MAKRAKPAPEVGGTGDEDNRKLPTPAAEFRRVRVEGEAITHPVTGRTVIMRNVQPEDLLTHPDIPEVLQTLAIKVLYGTLGQKEYDEFWETPEQVEKALDYAKSHKAVLQVALIYPRIVDEPQSDDEILITDLTRGERRFFFDYALLEATALTDFRERQTGDVGALEADENAAPATEQAASGEEIPETVGITDGPEVADGVGEIGVLSV